MSYTGCMDEKLRRHGQGTYTDKDGREWVGEFYNNDGPGLKLTI